jgi:hypothetical protein
MRLRASMASSMRVSAERRHGHTPRTSNPQRLLYGLAVTIVIACEASLATALSCDAIGGAGLVAGHVCLCLSIAALAYAHSAHHPEAAHALLQLTIWTAVAGQLGALVAGTLAFVDWHRAAGSQSFGGWLNEQLKGRYGGRSRHILRKLHDKRVRIEGADKVRPLVDVFASGGQREKFAALSAINQRFEPALAPALRLALKDTDPSVRVLASTVMTRLQAAYSDRLVSCQETSRRDPTSADAWRALGEAHAAFGISGLLERQQARDQLKLAAGQFAYALTLDPDDQLLRLHCAELTLELADTPARPPAQDGVRARHMAPMQRTGAA